MVESEYFDQKDISFVIVEEGSFSNMMLPPASNPMTSCGLAEVAFALVPPSVV